MSRGRARKARQAEFSDRENDLMDLLEAGQIQKEAAVSLGLSPRTVEGYLKNIRAKTGTKTTAAAIASRARRARPRRTLSD
jgi:LuxR family quorum sensing-dependent transcriptional regulator